MTIDCIPDTSYFATPEFIGTVLHILSAIEIPIHAFGTYAILYKTPKHMKSVKWPMMNLHFWSLILDLSVSLLTVPFVLFPAFAGYPLGILSYMGIPTSIQIHLVVTEICVLGVSFPAIFANRYIAVTIGIRKAKKNAVLFYVIAIYTFAFTFLIPFTLMSPEQTSAVKEVFRSLPCLPMYIYEGPVYVVTLDPTGLFTAYSFIFSISVSGISFFITLTIKNLVLQTKNRTVSQKTAQLQRRFLKGLMIQTLIPLVVLCPLVYLGYSVTMDYYNQELTNITFILFGCHGLLSTVAMLAIHVPYREATMEFLRKMKVLKMQKVQVRSQRNSNVLVFSTNEI